MVESEQEDDRSGFNQWGRAVEDPDLVARTDGVSPPFFFTAFIIIPSVVTIIPFVPLLLWPGLTPRTPIRILLRSPGR